MWRPKIHSVVNVLQNIIWIIFMFSAVIHTQQDEIHAIWNKRLYPTNSVYESGSSIVQTSSVQSPLLKNRNGVGEIINADTSQKPGENLGDAEEEYDEDQESEISESSENHGKTRYETNDEEFSEEYDSELEYDYYDNETNSQVPSADVIDYTSTTESMSHENIWDIKNSSIAAGQLAPAQYDGVNKESGKVERKKSEETDDNEGKNKQESENIGKNIDEEILIGEAVVSVITTKSVVNGTYAVPIQLTITTEQMAPPPTNIPNMTTQSVERSSSSEIYHFESTEDSIIVASVQTSRSISGAHYLPFNLNNADRNTNTSISDDINTNKSLLLESTESIIDKLDRVQSELSSGFLTGGFRTADNALQLDVLSEQHPTSFRKIYTTTGRPPVISKFIPRRTHHHKSISSSTESGEIRYSEISQIMNDQAQTETPKIHFKIPWPGSPRARSSSTTTSSSRGTTQQAIGPIESSAVQDINAFLPAGLKSLKKNETTEKSLLRDILARSKVNLSSLLPANYVLNSDTENKNNEHPKNTTEISKNPVLERLFSKSKIDISALLPLDFDKRQLGHKSEVDNDTEITSTITAIISTTSSTPIQKTLQELFSKSNVNIVALLPPGYQDTKNNTEDHKNSMESMIGTTSKTSGGIKLVFPSRPGGRKAISKVAIQQNRAPDMLMFVTPKIQKGWPTRITTEFTGWPTPSTTPISIEKLLEAARTATVSSLNSSIIPITTAATTTSTSTTTSTTVRPTTPGLCEIECEVAGTIRIIGNTTWVPELLDRNTREWQQLAKKIEREMNLVFLKSAILRKWYKNVRIDAFSQGSILVDYFIVLQELTQKVNTQELRVLFHDSLRANYAHRWNETKGKSPMRLGEFVIDSKFTDFVIIPKIDLPQLIEKDDRLIPQWAIAVIVIGVGGLLFIIVFGVSVLINRQNASKLKPPISGMCGEEAVKNIIHSSHVSSSHRSPQDYPKSEISTIWNETDTWREKSFESNSNKILVDGMLPNDKKYNAYDSWRSEWNGYYNQTPYTSSKFASYASTTGFSHPPDYDINF